MQTVEKKPINSKYKEGSKCSIRRQKMMFSRKFRIQNFVNIPKPDNLEQIFQ